MPNAMHIAAQNFITNAFHVARDAIYMKTPLEGMISSKGWIYKNPAAAPGGDIPKCPEMCYR